MQNTMARRTHLLETVLTSVKNIGEAQTIIALQKAASNTGTSEAEVLEIITKNVINIYKISRKELFNGRSRIIRSKAIGAACFVIREELDWSLLQLATHFNSHFQNISKYIKETQSLDPRIKADEKMMQNLMKLQEVVKNEIHGAQ